MTHIAIVERSDGPESHEIEPVSDSDYQAAVEAE